MISKYKSPTVSQISPKINQHLKHLRKVDEDLLVVFSDWFCFRSTRDTAPVDTSVERIGDFYNPNPVQYFHCVIQSDPNPMVLSKYLIRPVHIWKKLIKHLTAVIKAVWISTSDPAEFFSKSSPIRFWKMKWRSTNSIWKELKIWHYQIMLHCPDYNVRKTDNRSWLTWAKPKSKNDFINYFWVAITQLAL